MYTIKSYSEVTFLTSWLNMFQMFFDTLIRYIAINRVECCSKVRHKLYIYTYMCIPVHVKYNKCHHKSLIYTSLKNQRKSTICNTYGNKMTAYFQYGLMTGITINYSSSNQLPILHTCAVEWQFICFDF